MSDTDEIIKELTGALTSNTEALSQLKMQVAKQGDTLAEVKRHGESVKNKVDWDNLGTHLYEGVASATVGIIEKTTSASEKMLLQAQALERVSETQFTAVKGMTLAAEANEIRGRSTETAIKAVFSAAEALRGSYRVEFTRMMLTGALTASLGLLGGYFYAKDVLVKSWHSELGADLIGDDAKDYCRYANGNWQISESGKAACVFWKTPDPE